MIETAFVLGVLLLLLIGLFDYCRFLMVKHLVANAAREAARLAVVGTDRQTTADIQQAALGWIDGLRLENTSGTRLASTDIQVYRVDPTTGNPLTSGAGSAWTGAAFGEGIAVRIDARLRPMAPTFGALPNPVPISTMAIMRSEAN
jgi:Flp pilus assembly protein TadG